ncbi:oxidoreductase [Cellulomonas xiejunii]|uniref:FAD-dependent oxidoreductase n=1 Tax=Cellulomonas xiejunii TaxID=2968083 RepID=A0ABY5KKZ5_9CELL|nr:FAD-dependent oxidoreductase [Cellulomonas xiejunii]MCC2320691.1 FAD-dependent oxidoreductase [Cellulomonas xiejunii]UUI70979.1 FAD-dependent oxidoreductase [Cellulomonas xiejunii]
MFDHLLSRGRIGRLETRNRIVMPPMHVGFGRRVEEREVAYFAARAAGGVGLIITGTMTTTSRFEDNEGWPKVEDDGAIPDLARLADAVHAGGALLAGQLTPGSGRVGPPEPGGEVPVSASATPWLADPSRACRELTTGEVEYLVEQYGPAAARLAAAGFDAVDIHSHTGYLIDQFMSSQWNQRTDRYGGSLENRLRFPLELIAAARAAAPELAITFRLTVDHHMPGGRSLEESLQMAPIIAEAGIHLLMVDDGAFETVDWIFPPYYMGDAPLLPGAAAVRAVVDVPVMATGNITPEIGDRAVAAGEVDFIGMGRALIADPDLPRKLAAAQPAAVRPCIRCNQLCVGNILAGEPLGCAVNPEVGFEAHLPGPAPEQRHVVVVGAGPAGLEVARVAATRGHRVDVYDEADHAGGVLWPAATPDFKRELRRMVDWWQGQLAELPVSVHLGHRITADSSELRDADQVVVATGSTQLVPASIPGTDRDDVVDVLRFHQGAPVGHRVVMVGGGLSGSDAALELANEGHDVTVVEMLDEIARDMLVVNRITLLRRLDEAGVRLLTSTRVREITDDGVIVEGPDGVGTLPADTVVLALGSRPRTDLFTELTAAGLPVQAVGDCVEPAKVGEAVNSAYALAAQL